MCCVCVIPERALFEISAVILAELWYKARNDNFALCAKEFAFHALGKTVLQNLLCAGSLLGSAQSAVIQRQYDGYGHAGTIQPKRHERRQPMQPVQFMLQMLVEGAGEGAVVLGAQYWGKNRLEPIPHIIGAVMRFGGGMAVVMFLIVRLAPEQLLNLLSNDPLVIA